jgi:FKBP-type peptidyl-prolyl cis-trans isomerase
MDRSDRYPQPLVIDVAGIEIRGLVSTLTMMRPGDHWKIFIPSSMAYGKAGKPNVAPPNAMLIFDLTLEKVTKPRP